MENNAVLYHHGIKGQRWGVRRFQTKDGGLTDAGRKRYSLGETIHNYKVKKKRQKALEKARLAKAAKAEHEKKAVEGKVDLKDMTDDEIRKAIARKQLENAYTQLHPKQVSKGEAFAKTVLNDMIKPAAVNSGRQFLQNYLDKVGKDLLKDKVDPKSIDALKDQYTKLDYQKKIQDLKRAIKNPDEKSLEQEAKEAEWMTKKLNYEEALDKANNRKTEAAEKAAKAAEKAAKAEGERKKAEAQKQVDEYFENWAKGEKPDDGRYSKKGSDIKNSRDTTKPKGIEQKTERLSDDDVEIIPPDNDWGKRYNDYMNSSSAKTKTEDFVNSVSDSTALAVVNAGSREAAQSYIDRLIDMRI